MSTRGQSRLDDRTNELGIAGAGCSSADRATGSADWKKPEALLISSQVISAVVLSVKERLEVQISRAAALKWMWWEGLVNGRACGEERCRRLCSLGRRAVEKRILRFRELAGVQCQLSRKDKYGVVFLRLMDVVGWVGLG